MKKETKVILHDVTEDAIRNVFSEAFYKMGLDGGKQIPIDLMALRTFVLEILFKDMSKE